MLHPERPREIVVTRLPFTRQTVPAIILLPTPDDWEAVPQLISKDYLLRHEAVVLRADWLNHLLKLVRGEPFSTLLPIRPETYEAIKASMLAKGFDPTHPAHVWDRDGLFTLVDGYTRDKAAGEVGITRLLAFVHHFQDETSALGFAIQCQTARRNITDGEMFVLVGVYDKKVKPGSTQQRQEGGTFAPRASTDALGKSSKKTGDVLNTSATTVDRVRYLHKHADASTKAAVTNNKVTLSRACETVRKKLAAAAKAAKIHPETNGDAPKEKPLAFDATPESDIAFAAWHPVVRREPALSADIEDEAQAKREVEYVLVEELLDLPASLKDLGAPANHRVLVSPQFDLFADEVPAKTVRKVLHTAAEAKKFDFLFTTRNPERLQEFSWEMNTFAGVSIFGQNEVAAAEDALLAMDGLRKWLVIEQLTMELTFKHLDQLDWLVVREGAGVPSAALDPYALKSLLQQAWTAKCPVLFERGVIYRPMDAPKATQGVADKATVQTKSATTGDGEQNRE